MKILFNLWPWEKTDQEDVSLVMKNRAMKARLSWRNMRPNITTDEGEYRNDGSSILNIDKGIRLLEE